MSNSEEYEMLCNAIAKCVPILSDDEFRLVVRSCGAKFRDCYGADDDAEQVAAVEVVQWEKAA